MTSPAGLDPFAVFGVEHRLDLDERALEKRYLQLSRDSHPDLHRAEGAADCAAVLARAAEINDSWRVLRDRWRRARSLLELRAADELERQKTLDPVFLAGALELAEEVAFCEPAGVPALRTRLQAEVETIWTALQDSVARGDFAAAARALHQSRYPQKALADLQHKTAEAAR